MSLNKREKRSFIVSLGVHAVVIAVMAYGLFSVPSLPEPPQGEMAIDFDLSGGFNNISIKKSPENISKKPVKKTTGKMAQADVGQKEIVQKIAAEKKKKEQERLEAKKAAAEKRQEELEAKKKAAEEKRKRDLEAKEIAENKAAEEKREKELAFKKEKELLEKKEREAKKLKEAEEKKKKELAEKKRKEAEEKKKKALAEKKRKEAEEKKKKELAEKKRKEAEEKKKQALLEKKKKEEGQKKRFNDDRIANLLKSKDNNKATQQKTSGSGRDPVADILSKTTSKDTGAAGRQGSQNTSNAHKLGGGLSWSDKAAIVNALRPCWESYQTVARGDVIVDFSLDGRGYLKGNVGYVSGDRSAFSGAKRAVPECASPIRGIDLSKLSGGKDFRITFTPLDIRF